MTAAPKTDLTQAYAPLYAPPEAPLFVDVPDLPFLTIHGQGAPGSPDYTAAVDVLSTVAYGIRFALLDEGKIDYAVMPMEASWGSGDRGGFDADASRDRWRWALMILQPPQVDGSVVRAACAAVQEQNPGAPTGRLRLETRAGGECVQALHVGAYGTQSSAAIAELAAFAGEHGRALTGQHHEIYLSDPNRTPPEELRTIIRYPVVALD